MAPKMRHKSNISNDKRTMNSIKDDALPGDIVVIENEEMIAYLKDSGAIKEYVDPTITYQQAFSTEETSTLSSENVEESDEEDFDLGLGDDEPVKEIKSAKSKNKPSNLVG